MEEIRVGSYVYFGGSDRSFIVLRRQGDNLEILAGRDFQGVPKTRIINITRDEVTTASQVFAGNISTRGFRPGTRSRATRVTIRR